MLIISIASPPSAIESLNPVKPPATAIAAGVHRSAPIKSAAALNVATATISPGDNRRPNGSFREIGLDRQNQ